jgi:formate-dependent phosphoribosylglycinamide formyltransferase (GAR transformylase)
MIINQFIQLCLLLLTTVISIKSEQRQCQPITYYECKNIGYNQTYLPNKFNHQDQKDVALVVSRIVKDVFNLD